MMVKLYEEGDEHRSDGITVEASYTDIRTVRVDLVADKEGQHTAFLALIDVGEPNDEGKEMMELTNAKTVNLWFRIEEQGERLSLVKDGDLATELELMLQLYMDGQVQH